MTSLIDLSPNRRGALRSIVALVAAAGTASLDTVSAVAASETAAAGDAPPDGFERPEVGQLHAGT
jgi:hypothetical protein